MEKIDTNIISVKKNDEEENKDDIMEIDLSKKYTEYKLKEDKNSLPQFIKIDHGNGNVKTYQMAAKKSQYYFTYHCLNPKGKMNCSSKKVEVTLNTKEPEPMFKYKGPHASSCGKDIINKLDNEAKKFLQFKTFSEIDYENEITKILSQIPPRVLITKYDFNNQINESMKDVMWKFITSQKKKVNLPKDEFDEIIANINESPFELTKLNSAYFIYTISTSPTNETIEAMIICLLMLEGVYEVLNPIDRGGEITNSILYDIMKAPPKQKELYQDTYNRFLNEKKKIDNFMHEDHRKVYNEKLNEKFIYIKHFVSTGSYFGVTLLDRIYALNKEIKGKIILESIPNAVTMYEKEGFKKMTMQSPELYVTKLFKPDIGLTWFIK